jgi:hypothetical protein
MPLSDPGLQELAESSRQEQRADVHRLGDHQFSGVDIVWAIGGRYAFHRTVHSRQCFLRACSNLVCLSSKTAGVQPLMERSSFVRMNGDALPSRKK